MTHTEPDIDSARLPRHVAIIMDGNGRWAKARGWDRLRGHREGAESVRTVVRACRRLGVEVLTLFSFSTENWQRSEKEVNGLMKLLSRFLKSELREMLDNGIRLNALGEIERFPASVYELLRDVMKQTESNTDMILNLALSYGGRAEITRAARRIAQRVADGALSPEDIGEQLISDNLFTASMPDPDLLIRTGGEWRVSNFLLWQIAYAEIYMVDIHWPDFREKELFDAIRDYQSRERRFGKTSEQIDSEGRTSSILTRPLEERENGDESMLVKRWLTAIVLAALVIGVLLSGWTPLFFAILLIASALSHREYLVMAFPDQGQKPVRAVGIVLGLGVMGRPMFFPDQDSTLFFTCLVVVSFLFFLFWPEDVAGSLNRMGRFLLGLFYAPLLLSLFVYVWRESHATMWIFLTLGVVFMGDSGAFYAGRYFGKHKLYPRMSPKKTVEGSLGGLAASVLFALIFSSLAMEYVRWWECAILAVALNLSGQLGDLFESMLKRSAGVKDSGAYLPGHGGMLDRIDGLLFSIPVLCLYLKYLFQG